MYVFFNIKLSLKLKNIIQKRQHLEQFDCQSHIQEKLALAFFCKTHKIWSKRASRTKAQMRCLISDEKRSRNTTRELTHFLSSFHTHTLSLSCLLTHTLTNTHTHTFSLSYLHTDTFTNTHTFTHSLSYLRITNTLSYLHIHTHTRSLSLSLTLSLSYTKKLVNTLCFLPTHKHTLSYLHAHTLINTRLPTYTHVHGFFSYMSHFHIACACVYACMLQFVFNNFILTQSLFAFNEGLQHIKIETLL